MHFLLATGLVACYVVLAEQPPAIAPKLARPATAAAPAATAQKTLPATKAAVRPESATNAASTTAKPRGTRVLLITINDDHCAEELARLRKPGGEFEKLRSAGWKIGAGPENHLQVVERDAVPEIVTQIGLDTFPLVACIEKDEIVRTFREGCTTPLDMWTFGWLAKGIDERPPGSVPESARVLSTGNYRLRGNHWTVDGVSNPTRDHMVSHLRGPNHAVYILASQEIEAWSFEELRSLHDDLHEKYGGGISYTPRYGSSNRSGGGSSQFSAGRKTK